MEETKMKTVLRNVVYMLGSIMILLAAKNGMLTAITAVNAAIFEVAEGLVMNSVPLGDLYFSGFIGSVIGYTQLIVLIGCISVMIAGLLGLAVFFAKTEIDICRLSLQKHTKNNKTVTVDYKHILREKMTTKN